MSKKPIFCENIFKTAIWGGNNLSKIFDVDSPFEKTSEIWTASAHKNGETPITILGDPKTLSLSQYYKDDSSKEIFGSNCRKYEEFPLLIKWIDANDKLSVQVHPDDDYAKKHHGSFGKTEAWYIVSAKPGAQIVYGLKPGTTKNDLEAAMAGNRIEDVLNFVPVKEGDVFYIPAGMVHALLDGVVVYEIQQSSDITYRLHDWNRVDKDGNPRELHIKEALDVINFNKKNIITTAYNYEGFPPESITDMGGIATCILNSKYFKLKIHNIRDFKEGRICLAGSESFRLCSVLKGSITIGTIGNDSYSYQVKRGESFILPAAEFLNVYKIAGTATILEASVK